MFDAAHALLRRAGRTREPCGVRAHTRGTRGDLFLAGVALPLLFYAPLVNLLVPVLPGLAFTPFCRGQLAGERGQLDK